MQYFSFLLFIPIERRFKTLLVEEKMSFTNKTTPNRFVVSWTRPTHIFQNLNNNIILFNRPTDPFLFKYRNNNSNVTLLSF